jgi:glucosamine-6-phosphate deaminase
MELKNTKFGMLDVKVFKTRKEMGHEAARDVEARLKRIISEKGEATVVFAAAPSQNELLEGLCSADVDWTRVRALHMDEYIGLPKDHPAGFGNFLRRAIFDRLPFKEIHYIADAGEDEKEACAAYSAILEKYPPDIILLGVGENGHLAFNDPPVADFNDPLKVKVVELDDVCRNQQVNDGCFAVIDDVPKKAITLTMSAIMAVPEAVAVVPGMSKARAVDAMLNGPISTECPASILRTHPQSVLYLDSESASTALKINTER